MLRSVFANDRSHRSARRPGLPLLLWVGVALVLGVNDACASALGSLATSLGLFAALAALFVIKGWSAHLPMAALSSAGGALVVAGGAAWLWRARAASRLMGFAGSTGVRADAYAGGTARPVRAVPVAVPRTVDRDALLVELRLTFVRVQEAWDLGAMPALQALTTAEMLAELCLERLEFTGGTPGGHTDIVTLQANLFGFEEFGDAFIVSVEFSGLMRESTAECAAPFRELWMMTKSKQSRSGWKLARHQALL